MRSRTSIRACPRSAATGGEEQTQGDATIDPHADALPGPLRAIYPRIRDEQWLLSYRDIEGIRFALRNMSRRFSRGPRLEPAVRHLVDSRVELERRFGEFMPDVIAFALRFTS